MHILQSRYEQVYFGVTGIITMEKAYYNKTLKLGIVEIIFNRKHFLLKKSIGNTILNEENTDCFPLHQKGVWDPHSANSIQYCIEYILYFIITCYLQMMTILLLSFHFRCLFIYFSWLTVLASTSNIILNKNDDMDIPNLFYTDESFHHFTTDYGISFRLVSFLCDSVVKNLPTMGGGGGFNRRRRCGFSLWVMKIQCCCMVNLLTEDLSGQNTWLQS